MLVTISELFGPITQLTRQVNCASPSSPCYHLFSFPPINTSSTTLVLLVVSRFSIVVRFLSTISLILQLYDLSLILETDSTSRKLATKAWLYTSLSFSSIHEALIQKNYSSFIRLCIHQKTRLLRTQIWPAQPSHYLLWISTINASMYMHINILLFFFLYSL